MNLSITKKNQVKSPPTISERKSNATEHLSEKQIMDYQDNEEGSEEEDEEITVTKKPMSITLNPDPAVTLSPKSGAMVFPKMGLNSVVGGNNSEVKIVMHDEQLVKESTGSKKKSIHHLPIFTNPHPKRMSQDVHSTTYDNQDSLSIQIQTITEKESSLSPTSPSRMNKKS